ncbi:Cyclin-dependent kinase G-2, partial [Clarias magur]
MKRIIDRASRLRETPEEVAPRHRCEETLQALTEENPPRHQRALEERAHLHLLKEGVPQSRAFLPVLHMK